MSVLINSDAIKNLEFYSLYFYGKLITYTQPSINTIWDTFYGNEFKIDEIVDNVYISDFYSACQKENLKKHGITHIISVIAGVDGMYKNDFKYHIVSICDRNHVNIYDYFDECVEFINDCLSNGGKVLVHCKCGVSRSATIVCAYMIKTLNYNCNDAIKLMKEKRNCIEPNDGFKEQLKMYEKRVNISL